MYLVDHDAFFGLDLMFRKGRARRKLQQKGSSLVEVFLQYRRMEDDLFLGRECIELSAETVEITVYYRGASVLCALEDGVLDEMGDAGMVSGFIPCSAFDAQGTVTYRRAAPSDCGTQRIRLQKSEWKAPCYAAETDGRRISRAAS